MSHNQIKPKKPPGWTDDDLLAAVEESLFGLSNDGVCVACGETRGGTEPDAENYPCESCDEDAVFAFEALLAYGIIE